MMESGTVSTVSSVSSHLRRAMESLSTERFLEEYLDPELDNEQEEFNSRVFWSVNGFILVLFVGICLYCCYGDTSWLTNVEQRRRAADAEYQASLREREQRRKNAKIMAPEKRRRLLLASFRRHQVSMIVEEKDLIAEITSTVNQTIEEDVEATGSVSSLNNNEQLKLPTQALVPNCCAICLGDYDVGDQVVWSSNQECPHAFHQECILDWLIKMQPATPCPCCRQEFTDWQQVARERKIVWSGDAGAFNIQNVRF